MGRRIVCFGSCCCASARRARASAAIACAWRSASAAPRPTWRCRWPASATRAGWSAWSPTTHWAMPRSANCAAMAWMSRHVRARPGAWGCTSCATAPASARARCCTTAPIPRSRAPTDYDWEALLEGAAWLHLSGVTPALGQPPPRPHRCGARRAPPVRWCRSTAISAPSCGRPGTATPRASCIRSSPRPTCFRRPPRHRGGAGRGQQRRCAEEAAAAAAGARIRRVPAPAAHRHAPCAPSTASTSTAVGACWSTRRRLHRAPDYALNAIVDRIGAGDAFAAGVLHGLLERHGRWTTLHFGLAAACLKHSLPGDFNLVDVADVEALVRDEKLDVRR